MPGFLRAVPIARAVSLGLCVILLFPRPTGAAAPAAPPGTSKETPIVPSDTLVMVPPATRTGAVVDTLHGVVIADPYRWLEDDGAPEVRDWVEAQNNYTRLVLVTVPGRSYIHDRLAALLRIGTIDAPTVRGNRIFYLRRNGDQDQPVLLVQDGVTGAERVLLDPNTMSHDGTTAIDWWYPSPDGKLLAWGASRSGDEWSTLRVRDVETGADRSEAIERTRAASVAWLPDASGFYYTRYPRPGDVPPGEESYHRRIYFHHLGADAAGDSLVFGEKRAAEEWPDVDLSPDGRWLVVTVSIGWDRSELYLYDRRNPDGGWRALAEGEPARFAAAFGATAPGVGSPDLFIWTNLDAPRGRVLRVDPAKPERSAWVEVVPQGADALLSITPVAGRLFLQTLHDASSRVRIVDRTGVPVADLKLPVSGSVTTVNGEPDGTEAWLGFHSSFVPPTVYRVNPADGALTLFRRVEAPIDTTGYQLNQVWYPSKDGTKISMFLVQKKGVKKNGANPTLLTGYGGFNVVKAPEFQRNLFLWLEQGGILALPNLRGGGEYGEEWHRAGMLEKKQNVFDDFLAAARWLIREKYTSSSKLVIMGGSNGGLLVGAALTQAPELFRAVVCQVPLLDMLRYQKFLVARLWIPEYGSADDPLQFEYLSRYSPYQKVVDGKSYPAVLLTAAESDSRVAPLHARKMAARLQAATSSGRPVLLRLETAAGHGIGKPVSKVIDEFTDTWSFVFAQVGIKPKAPAAAAAKPKAKPAAKSTKGAATTKSTPPKKTTGR